MLAATSDPDHELATSAGAGDEVVVSEEAAAFLIRHRAAEIIEVIEPSDDNQTPE
jgi:hypothetical protein